MLSFWEQNSFLEYDCVIIGGGIVGLSTASSWLEQNPNDKVLLLEKGIFPTGASTKNAGFACFGSVSELWADLEKMGESEMLTLVEKRWQGLQKLLNRLGESKTGAKYEGSYELILQDDDTLADKMSHLNHLLKDIFKQDIFTFQNDLIQKFKFKQVKRLIANPFEFQIDTGKMMQNLTRYAQKLGVNIITGAEVLQFEEHSDEVVVVVKNQGFAPIYFKAKKVAICTNAFSAKLLPNISIKAGRGQVLATKPIPDLAFKGTFHFDEGFYYFRNYGNRVIFGGGRNIDFETENTEDFVLNEKILQDLEEKLNTIILPSQKYEVETRWVGIMAFSENDKKVMIQKYSEKVAVAVRLNGMGIAIGSSLGEEVMNLLSKMEKIK